MGSGTWHSQLLAESLEQSAVGPQDCKVFDGSVRQPSNVAYSGPLDIHNVVVVVVVVVVIIISSYYSPVMSHVNLLL